jgi:ribosome-associated translation inhibitor RaiA
MQEEDKPLELGGNIELRGFSNIDSGSMVILKKIIGNYAKKFSEKNSNFEKLSVSMKNVHKTQASEKYEVNGKLVIRGNPITAEVTDRNLFVAVDSVLKKIENQIED